MAIASDVLLDIIKMDVFKLGEFALKSGPMSPFYVDLRHISCHPKVLNAVSEAIYSMMEALNIKPDAICGVPYTALPVASVICSRHEIPMLVRRKERKGYGTKKMVEGIINSGETCLVIEDVVVSAASIIETVTDLRKEGLMVTDCIAILDRLQGGEENLRKVGITFHSLFTIKDLFSLYCSLNNVEKSQIVKVDKYLHDNVYQLPEPQPFKMVVLPFSHRAKVCSQPVSKSLFRIMAQKKTNLCVAADSLHTADLLKIADTLGPHICLLKTHINILTDFEGSVPLKLCALAKKHDFLILEDFKFSEKGDVLLEQYKNGLYKINEWADIVTVHGLPGPNALEILRLASNGTSRACIFVADMNVEGLMDESYIKQVVEMAEKKPEFAIGFLSQQRITDNECFIQLCPDVDSLSTHDSLKQLHKTPEMAVADGADIIIAKCISNSMEMVQTAIEYKTRGYESYEKRCKNAVENSL